MPGVTFPSSFFSLHQMERSIIHWLSDAGRHLCLAPSMADDNPTVCKPRVVVYQKTAYCRWNFWEVKKKKFRVFNFPWRLPLVGHNVRSLIYAFSRLCAVYDLLVQGLQMPQVRRLPISGHLHLVDKILFQTLNVVVDLLSHKYSSGTH